MDVLEDSFRLAQYVNPTNVDMLGKAMRDYAARVLFKASGRGEELPTLHQNKTKN